MNAYKKEWLGTWITSSLRTYVNRAPLGLPVFWLDMSEQPPKELEEGNVQILTTLRFPDRGGKSEDYAMIWVEAVVQTKLVPTDLYYHTRIKTRVVDIFDRAIPVMRKGGTDPLIYDKTSQVGILRRVPSETIEISPAEVIVPNASRITTLLEFQKC